MLTDPIIEEIHQIRQKLWQEAGENLDVYLERIKRIEEQYKDRLVRPEDLPPQKHQKPSSTVR
jgi:hypothetical protein